MIIYQKEIKQFLNRIPAYVKKRKERKGGWDTNAMFPYLTSTGNLSNRIGEQFG